jgi:UDP-glucose-4-epimerase GalE
MSSPILVTGAAGYIGSHAVKSLLRAGRDVVGLDNLSRASRGAIDALEKLDETSRFTFVEGDIGDRNAVPALLHAHDIRDVLHFAAFAYVGESVEEPLLYYANNTGASIALIDSCLDHGVERFVFSSTCATYGEPAPSMIPITESCPQAPINPYGRSKLVVEQALVDSVASSESRGARFGVAMLRYFNVAGCDPEGHLGEDHDPETHLIPIVLQTALGQRSHVTIFGDDYDTPDGTCVRDYIHVSDLVDAHLLALDTIDGSEAHRYNLGNGTGYSVREIIDAAERVTGVEIEVREGARRPGDPPTLTADASLARRELGWTPHHTDLDGIIESAWSWFKDHPDGY